MTCKSRLSEYDAWRVSSLFYEGGPYHIETSPLIYRVNQWTGFYTTIRQGPPPWKS